MPGNAHDPAGVIAVAHGIVPEPAIEKARPSPWEQWAGHLVEMMIAMMLGTDGILMLGAYGWAYVKPIRKLYYNLNITLISVIIAFVVGGIETLSIVANEFGLTGGIWDLVTGVDFGLIGIAIIAVFLGSWGISTLVYRWKGYDNLLSDTSLQVPSAGRDRLDTAA